LGPEGCGLIEVIVALTVLSVGLLATAGLVRAVSQMADQARAEGDAALLAQQGIEAALSERAAAPYSREDTLRFGGREYAVGITLEAAGPALERIRIDVVQVGPPGFGRGLPPVRSYGTRRRSPLPRLAPAASAIP
jgi:Tfp pilus assembly protein PilV